MAKLLKDDLALARRILKSNGLSPRNVDSWLLRRGETVVLEKGAPAVLGNQNHPCYWAARLLLDRERLANSDPRALHLGRFWGFAVKGMIIDDIVDASHAFRFKKNRGRGGKKADDLGKSLKNVLAKSPKATITDIWHFFTSDISEDAFFSSDGRTIFITGVIVDSRTGVMTFTNSDGSPGEIGRVALQKRINRHRT